MRKKRSEAGRKGSMGKRGRLRGRKGGREGGRGGWRVIESTYQGYRCQHKALMRGLIVASQTVD